MPNPQDPDTIPDDHDAPLDPAGVSTDADLAKQADVTSVPPISPADPVPADAPSIAVSGDPTVLVDTADAQSTDTKAGDSPVVPATAPFGGVMSPAPKSDGSDALADPLQYGASLPPPATAAPDPDTEGGNWLDPATTPKSQGDGSVIKATTATLDPANPSLTPISGAQLTAEPASAPTPSTPTDVVSGAPAPGATAPGVPDQPAVRTPRKGDIVIVTSAVLEVDGTNEFPAIVTKVYDDMAAIPRIRVTVFTPNGYTTPIDTALHESDATAGNTRWRWQDDEV